MKGICFICMANYCRSPVAEALLRKYLKNDPVNITSAGLNPILKADMDSRSRKYLEKNNTKAFIHIPKAITHEHFMKNDFVIALDYGIFLELNKQFPDFRNKVYLLNENVPETNLSDPYLFNDDKYDLVMEDIDKCVKIFAESIKNKI